MPEQADKGGYERLAEPDTIESLMKAWEAEPLTRTGSNEPYKVGEGDGTKEEREAVRAAFSAGEIDTPVVSYPNLNADKLQAGRERMLDLYSRSLHLPDSIDKDLMRELMRNKIYEVDRHLAVAAAWATDDLTLRQAHLDRAAEIQKSIFGTPDQRHFDAMLHNLRANAAVTAGLEGNDEMALIARQLLDLTGERPMPEDPPVVGITDHAREVLKRDLEGMFAVDDDILPPASGRKISHDTARIWLKLIQEASGMQAEGWKTNLTDGAAIETTRRTLSVDIGRGRAAFTDASLRHRNKHETRGHGQRGFNGNKLAQKGKPMAGFALPGSLDFEEGLMVAIEQISSDQHTIPGRQYFMAIGLMMGMDRDDRPRSFRETFEILWRRSALEAAQAGKQPNLDTIKENAYQAMMRITRGGALDTRDLAYYNGYVKASEWLNSIADLPHFPRKEQWSYVMSAQFDPTNLLHAAYIKR